MRLATCMALAGSLLMLSVAALSACGGSSGATSASSQNGAVTGGGKVVDVYSSLPMSGPSAPQTVALLGGIRLALAQAGGRAGPFTVKYTSLDDSSDTGGWDASQTAANARKVAADPRAVYYIGEFDDDASEVSMPILNEAGIPQVSPSNTYIGLTTDDPGSASGEPRRFWPTGTRTYLRIVPSDSVQSEALLDAMKQGGCAKVAVVSDDEPYGTGMARLIKLDTRLYGVNVVSDTGIDQSAEGVGSYTERVRSERPDCFLLAAAVSRSAVRLTEEVHAALPLARIFGPAGMCTSSWTNPRNGGVAAGIDPLIECTEVTRSFAAYPGGQSFLAAYRSRYRVADANPYAILGYEAMKLGLSTIASLGTNGDSKSAVLSALFATTARHSVLGTYGFEADGDTTMRSYGLYKVGPNGDPEFVKTITPPRAL